MFNFHKWYPNGLIIYLAPIHSLVEQQAVVYRRIHEIITHKECSTIRIIDAKAVDDEDMWTAPSVIFTTPYILLRNLCNNLVPTKLIKCIVMEEAHVALGKHEYVSIIDVLYKRDIQFRLMAFSPTPGVDTAKVRQVLANLRISKLKVDNNPNDVKIPTPTIHETSRLEWNGEGEKLYQDILEKEWTILIQQRVVEPDNNVHTVSVEILQQKLKQWIVDKPSDEDIHVTLRIVIVMKIALKKLSEQGFHQFVRSFKYAPHALRAAYENNKKLVAVIEEVSNNIGGNVDFEELIKSGTIDENDTIKFTRPKFEMTAKLLNDHLDVNEGGNKRALILGDNHMLTIDIYLYLAREHPVFSPEILMKPGIFKEYHRAKAIAAFNENIKTKVLVATNAALMGHIVGQVDLVIDFYSELNRTPQNMQQVCRIASGAKKSNVFF